MFIRTIRISTALVALTLWGCSDRAALETTVSPVRADPPVTPVTPPPLAVLPAQPVYQYSEPLPLPPRHVVVVTLVPAGARTLHEVQRVDVDVTIDRGAVGQRRINAAFITPQGLAWETQQATVELATGGSAVAHFSLPVAATFIEDQHLAGAWQVTTLDDGAETAAASFEVTP